jgi:hypothetical protein
VSVFEDLEKVASFAIAESGAARAFIGQIGTARSSPLFGVTTTPAVAG